MWAGGDGGDGGIILTVDLYDDEVVDDVDDWVTFDDIVGLFVCVGEITSKCEFCVCKSIHIDDVMGTQFLGNVITNGLLSFTTVFCFAFNGGLIWTMGFLWQVCVYVTDGFA